MPTRRKVWNPPLLALSPPVLRAVALALGSALCLSGAAQAENYFQVRYFYPSAGLEGVVFEGQYQYRNPRLSLGVRIPELSAANQNVSLSASGGAFFASASVNRSRERQGATYVALLGYTAPNPGLLTDATVTYVRADDERAAEGYSMNSLSLDLRGLLGQSWRWSAGGSMDHTRLNMLPDSPSISRNLNFGLEGKLGRADLRARTRVSQNEQGGTAQPWRWNAAADLGYPLTDHERLSANVTYDYLPASETAQARRSDTETLALTTDRFKPFDLGAGVTRADGVYSARFSVGYAFNEALSVLGNYGVTFVSPLGHAGDVTLEYHRDRWNLSTGVAAEYTPDVNGQAVFSVAPQLSLNYAAPTFTGTLRGNARYTSGQAIPWNYHVDAGLQTSSGRVTWLLNLRADSPTAKRPLTGEASLQALYQVSDRLKLNGSVRYQTGRNGSAVQFGAGVRYVF